METRHVPPKSGISRTLGIDLASQPRETAGCIVEWAGGTARVVDLIHRLSDDDLLTLMTDASISRVAIDAPFGWPLEFVDAISAYAIRDAWPLHEPRRLFLRETDRHVKVATGQQPLSVTTDRIAYSAMRCARLLTTVARGQPIDRSGDGRYIEVYPAAALRVWGFDPRRYKGAAPASAQRRLVLVDAVLERMAWLFVELHHRVEFARSDHAFDALIAALVARAVEIAQAEPVPAEAVNAARREGWIRFPFPKSLDRLVRGVG